MAWKVIKTCTKPSADTPYELWSDDVTAYMKTNYKDTGKWTLESRTTSGDNLVVTYTIIYKDEATKNEMSSDSISVAERTRVNAIRKSNNITEEVIMNEEV